MQIAVSPATAANIERLLSSGAFPDATGVVEEAIRRLDEADTAYVTRINEMIGEAVASLDATGGTPLTPDLADRITAEARERRAARLRHTA